MNAWATVVAGLAGTIVGVLSAWFIEFSRYRRQRRERWLDLRRDLAAQLLSAIDDVMRYSTTGPLTDEYIRESDKKADVAYETAMRARSEIDFVCTDSERDAASTLHGAMSDYYFRFLTPEKPESDLKAEVEKLRVSYVSAVRSELAPSSS